MNEDLIPDDQPEIVAHHKGSSSCGVRALDNTIQKTHIWLNDLNRELNLGSKERAYSIFRAVMHSLRDIMGAHSVAHLAAQLPMVLRGLLIEGWTIDQKYKCHSKEDFFWLVRRHFGPFAEDFDRIDDVVKGVFKVLGKHVSAGEIANIRAVLHDSLKDLVPLPKSH